MKQQCCVLYGGQLTLSTQLITLNYTIKCMNIVLHFEINTSPSRLSDSPFSTGIYFKKLINKSIKLKKAQNHNEATVFNPVTPQTKYLCQHILETCIRIGLLASLLEEVNMLLELTRQLSFNDNKHTWLSYNLFLITGFNFFY